jgi:retron-type reverse transcriptase
MKAFDKVPHRRLLHKLQMNGIGENYIQWIGSFLLNRKQKVSVNGESSEWKSVTSGIPQGSVLCPVLFVLYINDLPDAMEFSSEPYLYADDTKIFQEIYKTSDVKTYKKICI